MKKNLNDKQLFRLEQSTEKLNLSLSLLNRGFYNDSIIYSYLSMFYSVRALLITANVDSDDPNKILELIEEYYEPAGWTTLNIINIITETKEYKDKAESTTETKFTREEADKFSQNAKSILNLISKKILSLNEIPT